LTSDGAEKRLTRPKGKARDTKAAWSPDGSLIAFKRQPDHFYVDTDIYTIAPDGSGQTLIRSFEFGVDPIPDTIDDTLLWSPDGTHLLFPETLNVWALKLDGTLQLVFNLSTLMNDGGEWLLNRDMTFSPDLDAGTGYQGFLAFSAQRSNAGGFQELISDLFMVEVAIDESDVQLMGDPVNLTNTPDDREQYAAWHPAGIHLLYERIHDADEARSVVLLDMLAETEVDLVPIPLPTNHYEWSPNGNYIAFDGAGFWAGSLWYSSPWDPVSPSIHVSSNHFYHSPSWNPAWEDDIVLPDLP
jgi:dipeptidyl aminopeptidase/acylaminoacyl peptidase